MHSTETKRQFLILFPDIHLAYSPTTLNLFYTLKKNHYVELIAAAPQAFFSDQKVIDENITYVSFDSHKTLITYFKSFCQKISDLLVKPSEDELAKRHLFNDKTKKLIKYAKSTNREIIAVDFLALWCVQQAGKMAHLLSLEINENDLYRQNTLDRSILSVITQSTDRFNYLFPGKKPSYFIVQNAPQNLNFTPDYDIRKKTDLVYCGSAVAGFGIITCIDFIKDYPQYTLTIKGAIPTKTFQVIEEFYFDLIADKRLIIDREYLPEAELTRYLAKFRIGFAFYDFFRFSHLRTFNYYTAPSGKVFQYLNSGLPIIANTLPGFKFINENNCGKLINYLSSNQIKRSIDEIEENYILVAKNAKNTSSKNDFNEMIQPFLNFVSKNTPN